MAMLSVRLFLLTYTVPQVYGFFANIDKAITFDSQCMKAMCMADSGCTKNGCTTDQFGRLGCGFFRMNVFQFRQCYEPGRLIGEDTEAAWLRCAEDFACASDCIKHVAMRFRLKCYHKTDCETIARVHDGGARGCRTGATNPYWQAVRTLCADC